MLVLLFLLASIISQKNRVFWLSTLGGGRSWYPAPSWLLGKSASNSVSNSANIIIIAPPFCTSIPFTTCDSPKHLLVHRGLVQGVPPP